MQRVELPEQLPNVLDDRLVADAERGVFLRRLHDEREMELVDRLDCPAKQRRRIRSLHAIGAQHLGRNTLVTGEQQPGGTGSGVAQVEEVEQSRDAGLEGAL